MHIANSLKRLSILLSSEKVNLNILYICKFNCGSITSIWVGMNILAVTLGLLFIKFYKRNNPLQRHWKLPVELVHLQLIKAHSFEQSSSVNIYIWSWKTFLYNLPKRSSLLFNRIFNLSNSSYQSISCTESSDKNHHFLHLSHLYYGPMDLTGSV